MLTSRPLIASLYLLDIRYKELEGGECHERDDNNHLELVLLIKPILENSGATNLLTIGKVCLNLPDINQFFLILIQFSA